MSIDKHLNQLCITIPGKGQAIIVQFEEKRDFSVTVCLLQKSDLHVSDSIPSSPSTTNAAFDSSNHGPRLSSIPPMASVSPPPQAFGADVLPIMDSHIHPSLQPMPYQPHPQRTASVPIYSSPYFSPSSPPDMAYLNPYNMFLGRNNTNTHIPRVGSPLRHSFSLEAQHSSTSNAGSVSDGFSPTNSQSPMNVEGIHATVNPITVDREKTPVDTTHSPKADSQGSQSESGDFRDLMPQPRKLPFQSRPKRSISQPDTIVRDEVQKLSPRAKRVRGVPNTTSDKELRRFKTQGSQTIDLGVDIPMKSTPAPLPNRLTPQSMPEEIPNTGARDAECQTEMSSDSNASQQIYQPQFSVSDLAVLVTGPDVLRELDEATASLFEQYETDIANGSDNQASARFYLDQIYSKRRDFWLAKLEELAAGQWQQLSG